MSRHPEKCGMRTCNSSTEGMMPNVCIYSRRQRLFNTHKYFVKLCQSVAVLRNRRQKSDIRYRKNDREIKMSRRGNE
jgi:hypothetical protein